MGPGNITHTSFRKVRPSPYALAGGRRAGQWRHLGSTGFHNWVIANLRMADTLKAKGYHYQLIYAKNAGHTDGKVIAQTYPQALEWVWQGYTPVTK